MRELVEVPKSKQFQSCSGLSHFRVWDNCNRCRQNRFTTYLNKAIAYWIGSEFKQASSNCSIFK